MAIVRPAPAPTGPDFAALVLAPGVPLTHPAAALDRRAWRARPGVEIIGDIELFCRERAGHAPGAPLIAITGTNGKSTTTALIAHVLARPAMTSQMGGNIGVPILDAEPPSPRPHPCPRDVHLQIDLAPSLEPDVGILLNITPDHLDRHGTMENYAAIKQRLVEAADYAIVGVDDAWCERIFQHLITAPAGRIGITNHAAQRAGEHLSTTSAGCAALRPAGDRRRSTSRWSTSPRAGSCAARHNGQNAAAAFAAARAARPAS